MLASGGGRCLSSAPSPPARRPESAPGRRWLGGLPSLAKAHSTHEGQAVPLSCSLPPTSGTREQPSPHPCNKQRGMHLISPVQCDYRRKKRLTVGPWTETGGVDGPCFVYAFVQIKHERDRGRHRLILKFKWENNMI